jgi:YYY domain-containing protein
LDFLRAIVFFGWFELLSLPLRMALIGSPAPPDVRRLLSRIAGPVVLLLPLWFAAHAAGWVLGVGFGLIWIALWLWIASRVIRNVPTSVAHPHGPAVWFGYAAPGRPRNARRGHLAFDLLTLALFLGILAFRRWVPEMTTWVIDTSAAEKFMNGMIWWSTWNAPALPPDDYWLSGHPLIYYYWGHWHWSWVARIGGFAPETALTLAFARMVTLCWEAMVLLGRSVGLRLRAAAVAGLAAAWGGNPTALACAWGCWWPTPPRLSGDWSSWWQSNPVFNWRYYDYWKPSRAISDNLVDEFPAFTAILGDFHAHHLALPWIVAWLALCIAGWRWSGLARGRTAAWPAVWAIAWISLALTSILANAWLLPVIGFATLIAVGYGAVRCRRDFRRWILPVALALFALAILVPLGGALIRGGESMPIAQGATEGNWFERHGLRALPPSLRSTFGQLWNLWGLAVAPLALASAVRLFKRPGRIAAAGWIAGTLLVGATAFGPPLLNAAFLWIGVACWGVALAAGPHPWLPPRGAAALAAACAILSGLELIFIDDAYAGDMERYNTYFKLSFPVWPVMMVVAAQALLAAGRRLRQPCLPWRLARASCLTLIVLWLASLAVYPSLGMASRIAKARMGDRPARHPTLNAFDFLRHRERADGDALPYYREAEMLLWIRHNVPPGEVVAGAAWIKPGEFHVGGYDFNGRVASLAGHPAPLGWAHHEMQWRGEAGVHLSNDRRQALDRLYTAATPETMREAAAQLNARWVLYGVLEHDRYAHQLKHGPQVLDVLSRAGELAVAFPRESPAIFLFEFPPAAPKMDAP